VAGGHLQSRIFDEETSSPAASLPSVLMMAAVAAKENHYIMSCDVSGAYLNAPMTDDVYMRLDKMVATAAVHLNSHWKSYLQEDGTMIVKLDKALYGTIQAGKLWNDMISTDLKQAGFQQHPLDPCIFFKIEGQKKVFITLYVDDLLVTSTHQSLLESTYNLLIHKYKSVTRINGSIHNYVGMTYDFSESGSVKITMEKYIDEIIKEFNIQDEYTSPATDHLFQVKDRNNDINTIDNDKFHRGVAKLLYIAKRVRPDILCAVNFLSTRIQCADEDDVKKLHRVIGYLKHTRNIGIVLSPKAMLSVDASIDASHAVHVDAKGQTGVFIALGKGPIYVKSTKQKLVSKSSSETELIALSDGASQVIWSREFLIALGYNIGPAIIQQDNKSTAAMISNGRSKSDKTRHVKIRYFWVKQNIDRGEVKIVYTPTNDVIADILTKPLQGTRFKELREKLLNWKY
jgi:hypothetical protein